MAIDWELNLFNSDPALLERDEDESYERAAAALVLLAEPHRLRLLHALSVGEDTPQKAAIWADVPQALAERELAAMSHSGVLERLETPGGPAYAPNDGHLVVQLHLALAHGRERGQRHPRLLARRRGVKAAGTSRRRG